MRGEINIILFSSVSLSHKVPRVGYINWLSSLLRFIREPRTLSDAIKLVISVSSSNTFGLFKCFKGTHSVEKMTNVFDIATNEYHYCVIIRGTKKKIIIDIFVDHQANFIHSNACEASKRANGRMCSLNKKKKYLAVQLQYIGAFRY